MASSLQTVNVYQAGQWRCDGNMEPARDDWVVSEVMVNPESSPWLSILPSGNR